MNAPKVFIIVPVHNNLKYTRECLSQLRAQIGVSLGVIVVDDGSTDGTARCIEQDYPEVTLLSGSGQLWWTGAMVLACNHLLSTVQSCDFILTLNNDTVFAPNFVAGLVDCSLKHGRAIVAARCTAVGSGKELNVAGKFHWAEARRTYNGEGSPSRAQEYDFLTSRAVIYPMEVFCRIGVFNAKMLPHYHADMEFTYRAGKAGFPLVVDWDHCIQAHETKDTSGDHFCEGPYLTLRDAWNVLLSSRSMFYPPAMFRCIDLCCPTEYRARNKISFLLGAISASLGRTKTGSVMLRAYRRMKKKREPD